MQGTYHRVLPRRASQDGGRGGTGTGGPPGPQGVPEVARFASRIMSLVAEARDRSGADSADSALLDMLIGAALSGDDMHLDRVMTAFRRARVSDRQLVDGYIPAAARHMGRCWAEDALGFAAVSMGCARLQSVLHRVGREVMADQAPVVPGDQGRTVLLIVPAREQHTLGAMVAAHQMRRRGASVCLRFVPSAEELHHTARARDFDIAMISVAGDEHLAAAAKLVKSLRAESAVPIVAGGAICDRDADRLLSVGADHICNDAVAALAHADAPLREDCAVGRA